MKKQNFSSVRTFRNMVIATIAMLASGCSQVNEPQAGDTTTVTFNIRGLNTTYTSLDDVAMAPSRGKQQDAATISELWIMEDTTVLCHQLSTDADFCAPSIALTLGSHTLTFIGSAKSGQQIKAGVWSADKISDTYGSVKTITVKQSMSAQYVVMSRANYAIKWASDDIVPTGADSVFITISSHRSTLKAGLAGGDAALYKYGASISQKVGSDYSISVSGFCVTFGTEEQVTTTFVAKDANKNTIASYSKDVMVLSNRRTVISGGIFSSQPTFSISTDDSWSDDLEVSL